MTLLINSFSLPRQFDGSGWIRFGQGSYPLVTSGYPFVTSGSVISTNPHWLPPPEPAKDSLRPPAPSSAPFVTPLSLWSRTGIGATLAMIVDCTKSPGMTRTYILYFNCYIFCMSYLSLSPCIGSAVMPLPYSVTLLHCCTSGTRL